MGGLELLHFTTPTSEDLKAFTLGRKNYLNLSDVSFGLGYTKVAKGTKYIQKDRVANLAETLGILGLLLSENIVGQQQQQQITTVETPITRNSDFKNIWVDQGDFFELAMESGADGARKFRRWVTHEVLPELATNGAYIADAATPSQIADAVRYHISNISNLVSSIAYENFDSEFEKLTTYYSNRSGRFRREILLQAVRGIEDKKKGSDDIIIRASCDAILVKLLTNQIHLGNKVNGGIKAYKTRTIRSQERKIGSQNDRINELCNEIQHQRSLTVIPNKTSYTMLPVHGMSHNAMYYDIGAQTVKSSTYRKWIYKFPFEHLPTKESLGITPSSLLALHFGFIAKPEFDCPNFLKSAIDVITQYYEIDDNNVALCSAERWGDCDTYDTGKIYVHISCV